MIDPVPSINRGNGYVYAGVLAIVFAIINFLELVAIFYPAIRTGPGHDIVVYGVSTLFFGYVFLNLRKLLLEVEKNDETGRLIIFYVILYVVTTIASAGLQLYLPNYANLGEKPPLGALVTLIVGVWACMILLGVPLILLWRKWRKLDNLGKNFKTFSTLMLITGIMFVTLIGAFFGIITGAVGFIYLGFTFLKHDSAVSK